MHGRFSRRTLTNPGLAAVFAMTRFLKTARAGFARTTTAQVACAVVGLALGVLGALALFALGGGVPTPSPGPLTVLAPLGLSMMGAVIGDRTQNATPSDFLKRDVYNQLILFRRNRFPIDTIMRRMEQVRLEQEKWEWYEKDALPREATANGDVSGGGSTASISLQSGEGAIFRADDMVVLPDDGQAVLYVDSVSGDTLNVRALDGGSVPSIEDGNRVIRMAPAKPEFFDASDSRAVQEVGRYNYVQAIDGVLKISGRREATMNHTNRHSLETDLENQLYDFRNNIENAVIAGQRSKQQVNGENLTTVGGILSYINSKQLSYTASSFSEEDLIDWHRQIFTGNSGSETRWLFADPYLVQDLAGVSLEKVRRDQQESKELDMEVSSFVTEFGRTNVMPHFGLDELGFKRKGIVLDMNHVRRGVLRPMKRVNLTLEEQGTDGRGVQLKETFSLMVGYEDAHAVIDGAA